jgi:excisionase family DNA binding protein
MTKQSVLPLPNPSDWLSVNQAAEALGVRRGAIYQMMADGRLRRYRIGSHTVLWNSEVTELAAAVRLAGVAPCPGCGHRWRAHPVGGGKCIGNFGACECELSRATVSELNRKEATHV